MITAQLAFCILHSAYVIYCPKFVQLFCQTKWKTALKLTTSSNLATEESVFRERVDSKRKNQKHIPTLFQELREFEMNIL